jgi:hypothetical protein
MPSTTARTEDSPGLYPGLLGASWIDLDPAIRRAHLATGVARGRLTMHYGTVLVTALLRRALRLPPSGSAHETRLTITRDGQHERWARTIGRRSLVTQQRGLPDGRLAERIGVAELRFRLHVVEGALSYVPAGAGVTIGRWSIPLPRWLAPRVEAREESAGDHSSRVRVRISLPLIGFFMAYDGTVEWETVG